MSQHDYTIADADGATFLADLNDCLAAVATTNKGSTRPSTINPGQLWIDDNTPSATVWTLNLYDGSDDIALGLIDTTNNTFTPTNTSFPKVSVTGSAAPTNGMYLPAADTVALVSGGAEAIRMVGATALFGLTAGIPSVNSAIQAIAKGGVATAISVIANSTATASALGIYNSGNGLVGSITFDPTSTAFNTTSDGRLKDEQRPLEDVWDIIEAVQPKTYVWNHVDGGIRGVGFIAQELHEFIPESVQVGDEVEKRRPGEEGFMQWSMDMSKLVPYLWAGMKGLRAENRAMSERINALEARLEVAP